MAAPVLKAQHLGIQFGGLKAVDDFNMEIGESELVGLIGPNGAGKTDCVNTIMRICRFLSFRRLSVICNFPKDAISCPRAGWR